ncbi:MAG: thiamine pyrophosphate-binding protein [Roseovarius sp.]|nr:thiamine pyrophosphate-binding protein [Roseovarius sp.]
MRGADAVIEVLHGTGCTHVFTVSGNQIMPVFDACLGRNIRLVHARHEAAAGYMAEGYAQISGKPGMALVAAGAGLGNAIAPLIASRASQTPLVLLSGDSPVSLDGKGAFQEMNQIALTESVAKLSCRVTSADDIADILSNAINVAQSGQPGPVHISLPADVLESETGAASTASVRCGDDHPDLSEIFSFLGKAAKPLVLLGPELSGYRKAPGGLAMDINELNVPVIAMESPRGGNDPNLGRLRNIWAMTDFVLALGKPIDFSIAYGSEKDWPLAHWITVHGTELESARARRNLGDRLISSKCIEPRSVLRNLAGNSAKQPKREQWQMTVSDLLAERPSSSTVSEKINSRDLCLEIQRNMSPKSILVCDGGEFGQWAQTIDGASTRIVNGVSGAIGGALCHAIGAKAAAPGSEIFVLTGDGAIGFHLAEFETAVREELPFISVIGNDRCWHAEHELQRRKYGKSRLHSCKLSGARYDKAAKALGGFGIHVTCMGELADAIDSARKSRLPSCINVEIEGLPAPCFTP